MKKVDITIRIEISDEFTNKEIVEWIKYKLGLKGDIERRNRLTDEEFDITEYKGQAMIFIDNNLQS